MQQTVEHRPYQRPLVVFGVVMASFTALRVGFMGVGELVFLGMGVMALIQALYSSLDRRYVFSQFWGIYLILGVIGFAYNLFVLELATGTYKGLIFDTSAYFMLLLACLALEQRFIVNGDRAYHYVKSLFLFFIILMSFLYVLNFFTPRIGPLSLRYYQYFAPFVVNVHQIAMLITPMAFLGLVVFEKEQALKMKIFVAFLMLMSLVMLLATGATKGLMGVVLGTGAYIASKLQSNQSAEAKVVTLFGALSLGMLVLIQGDILAFAERFFTEADDHGGRAFLYGAALDLIAEAWLFGRGNGPHIYYLGKFNDAHQTFLTALLQVGLVGFVFFVRLLLHILLKAYANQPAVFAAMCAIMVYAIGGDILRRLPIWMVLIMLYHTASQAGEENNNNKAVQWG